MGGSLSDTEPLSMASFEDEYVERQGLPVTLEKSKRVVLKEELEANKKIYKEAFEALKAAATALSSKKEEYLRLLKDEQKELEAEIASVEAFNESIWPATPAAQDASEFLEPYLDYTHLANLAAQASAPAYATEYAINVGDDRTYEASDGTIYVPDVFYTHDDTEFTTVDWTQERLEEGEVGNTENSTLFWTERLGAFTYSFPNLENGLYDVTIDMAESDWENVGDRLFYIQIQDNKVEGPIDLVARGGGKLMAVQYKDNTQVNDHTLVIKFLYGNSEQVAKDIGAVANAIRVKLIAPEAKAAHTKTEAKDEGEGKGTKEAETTGGAEFEQGKDERDAVKKVQGVKGERCDLNFPPLAAETAEKESKEDTKVVSHENEAKDEEMDEGEEDKASNLVVYVSWRDLSGIEMANMPFRATAGDTIRSIKHQVCLETGFSVYQQMLMSLGMPLKDKKTLAFYKINHGSTLQLRIQSGELTAALNV